MKESTEGALSVLWPKELLYFYSIFPVAFDDWTTITSDQARSLPAGSFPP